MHSVKILVRHSGEVDMEDLLRKKGVTQGEPLSIMLYGLSMYILVEKIQGKTPDCFSRGIMITSEW